MKISMQEVLLLIKSKFLFVEHDGVCHFQEGGEGRDGVDLGTPPLPKQKSSAD